MPRHPPAVLRWTVDASAPGAINMELDASLWRAVEGGACGDLLLRLYRWDPPAISLGFHQPQQAVDLAAAHARGVEVVRRPTGGAAVLHWNEWTYAVVGPLGAAGIGTRVTEIYEAVGTCLVLALGQVGVGARLAGSGRPAGVACFAALGGHEIQVEGRKLVGSALRRGRRAFLQHGSILTGPEHMLLGELLTIPDGSQERASLLARERVALREHTTHLAALGVLALDAERFAHALAAALGARAGVPTRRVANCAALLPEPPLRT